MEPTAPNANATKTRAVKTVLVSMTHDAESGTVVILGTNNVPAVIVKAANPEAYDALRRIVDDPTLPHSVPSQAFDPKRFFAGLVDFFQDDKAQG